MLGHPNHPANVINVRKREMAMGRGIGSLMAMAAVAGVLACSSGAPAQTTAPAENASPTADNAVMLTIFLKHDQSRPLSELNAQLARQGFYKAFGRYRTEFYPTYDYKAIGIAQHDKAQ